MATTWRDNLARLTLVASLPLSVWACSKANGSELPALSKAAPAAAGPALPAFATSASPGFVPCGANANCPVTKSARKVCCNAPGVPPMCRSADRCGQGSQFKYSGMLSCNETADCKGIEPNRDVVCCLTDDGFRAEGVPGPYNRAGCVPRAACRGSDLLACASDSECPKGKRCQQIAMGTGVEVGGCL
jgi:hypothetical protein